MEESELITRVRQEMKDLSDKLEDDDYTNAVNDAENELSWELPITDGFKLLWLKNRVKRHLLFYLCTASSYKYKVKQFSLNQRFDHLKALVKEMDADFEKVIDDRPDVFADVEAYKLFGTQISAGFAYNEVGEDITYSNDNSILITPSSSS